MGYTSNLKKYYQLNSIKVSLKNDFILKYYIFLIKFTKKQFKKIGTKFAYVLQN